MAANTLAYTDADRPRLREFTQSLRAAGAPGCWHVGDLVWGLFLMSIRYDLAANVRLWPDADAGLLGFAWFNPADCSLLMQVRPGPHTPEVQDQMLAWAEARWQETVRGQPESKPRRLVTGAFANDAGRRTWLERQGFTQGEGSYVHYHRPLAEPIPGPRLPGGYTVRGLAGEHEVASRASAHREAFDSTRLTDEHYRRLRQMPEYAPELDVVAVAPGGVIGAFCQGWLDPVNKVGEFEPVGTRPAHQRQGLGKAVLLEGLRRMKALGMESAFVCTEHDNTAAQQLYQAVGFSIRNTDFDYFKT
jgi:mycothiol synthase